MLHFQEVISSLSKKEHDAIELAERYSSRVGELERLTQHLQGQLEDFNHRIAEASSRPGGRGAAGLSHEEFQRKQYFEEQLRLAKSTLSQLKSQRGPDASAAAAGSDGAALSPSRARGRRDSADHKNASPGRADRKGESSSRRVADEKDVAATDTFNSAELLKVEEGTSHVTHAYVRVWM